MVVGIGVPADRETVDPGHRPIAWPEARGGVEEDVREGVGDDPFDACSRDHGVHPGGVLVVSADLVVELLPGFLRDAVVTQPVELRECRHQRGHERVRTAAFDIARNVFPGARSFGWEGERLVVRREGVGTRLCPAGVALLQELQQPHLAVVQRPRHVVLVHIVEAQAPDVRRNVERVTGAPELEPLSHPGNLPSPCRGRSGSSLVGSARLPRWASGRGFGAAKTGRCRASPSTFCRGGRLRRIPATGGTRSW